MSSLRKSKEFTQEFERLSLPKRIACMDWLRWMCDQLRAGWSGDTLLEALLLRIRKT